MKIKIEGWTEPNKSEGAKKLSAPGVRDTKRVANDLEETQRRFEELAEDIAINPQTKYRLERKDNLVYIINKENNERVLFMDENVYEEWKKLEAEVERRGMPKVTEEALDPRWMQKSHKPEIEH